MASSPRYGLTVTASAPSPSNSATAWRAAVEPMSPRFASIMHRHVGRDRARSRSSAASPAGPERLEEREVRLDGRGVRQRPLEDEPRERLDAAQVRREAGAAAPPDRDRGRGRGRCRRRPTARRAARRQDRCSAARPRRRRRARPSRRVELAAAGAAGGMSMLERPAAGSWPAGTNQPGRDAPSRPETRSGPSSPRRPARSRRRAAPAAGRRSGR